MELRENVKSESRRPFWTLGTHIGEGDACWEETGDESGICTVRGECRGVHNEPVQPLADWFALGLRANRCEGGSYERTRWASRFYY